MQAVKIELKDVGQEGKFKYRELLKAALEMPKNHRSMDIVEMRACNKILTVLENADGFLYVTPEQHRGICERIETLPWNKASAEAERFVDDVKAAPTVEMGEAQ